MILPSLPNDNDRDLDPIQELLCCPIMVPDEGVVLKCDSLSNREKNVTCATLFYCANWFREASSNSDSLKTLIRPELML